MRRILKGRAVAAACGSIALLGACSSLEELYDESTPDDPADVVEWAQANNLLTAEDVEAVLGSGTTVPEGWILELEEGCLSGEHDSLGVDYYLPEDVWQLGECVIFETGQEVYAAIERDLFSGVGEERASTVRYEPALVGADILEAVGYEVPDDEQATVVGLRTVVVSTEDLVISIGTAGGEAMTREQIDDLAQTAVDKLVD